MEEWMLWGGFNLLVVILLAADLVSHRKDRAISIKEAAWWSAFWIGLALAFNGYVYYSLGHEKGINFLASYLIEKSLSVDNLFVFLLVFGYFRTPSHLLHKVLFWGVLGAIVMRGLFIFLGLAAIAHFGWILYLFGGFLVITGVKLAFEKGKEMHPEKNPVLKLFRRCFPVTSDYVGGKFFVKQGGRLFATPLFCVLLIVETTDIVFAIDSIPAVMAITTDAFIVYTSNIFAILGLRALYFALAGAMGIFSYLHYGLAAILVLIGGKMLAAHWIKIPVVWTLGGVAAILAISIGASVILSRRPSALP